MTDSSVMAKVKPSPMPRPSAMLSTGGFLDAKDSARAKMMQLTTISGINMPSACDKSGRNALSSMSIIVTKDAMMMMYAGMRTLSWMMLRSRLMNRFEKISTAVTARPMPMPFMPDVVMASVGHIPSISTNVGFSQIRPFSRTLMKVFF